MSCFFLLARDDGKPVFQCGKLQMSVLSLLQSPHKYLLCHMCFLLDQGLKRVV